MTISTITQDNCTMDRDACIATDIALRNQLVTAMLEESRGMIASIAYKYNTDVEDSMQQAAIIMLEVWPKIPGKCANVKGYLHRSVRNGLNKFHKHVIDEFELSLDMPFAGSNETLATTIADTRQEQDTTRVDTIIETVHKALHECMIEEQEYAVKSFGIAGFTPIAPEKRRKGRLKPSRDIMNWGQAANIRASMLLALRKHPQVQALLTRTQRETATL